MKRSSQKAGASPSSFFPSEHPTGFYSASRPALGFLSLVLIWGTFPIAVKWGVSQVPPFLFAGLRFLAAGLLLAGIAQIPLKLRQFSFKQHIFLLLFAMLIVAVPAAGFFWAVQFAPPGVLSIIWATSPIFAALLSIRSRDGWTGWRTPTSLLLGIGGITLVFSDQAGQIGQFSSRYVLGEAATMVSAALSYPVCQLRDLPSHLLAHQEDRGNQHLI